jgi:hypothetical protein
MKTGAMKRVLYLTAYTYLQILVYFVENGVLNRQIISQSQPLRNCEFSDDDAVKRQTHINASLKFRPFPMFFIRRDKIRICSA